jgi:Cdc6-like AAA superfamily ATPase
MFFFVRARTPPSRRPHSGKKRARPAPGSAAGAFDDAVLSAKRIRMDPLSASAVAPAPPRCVLEAGADALHPRVSPAVLPCREVQAGALTAFLSAALDGGRTGSLHVCGSPGVGKTATITSVLAALSSSRPFAVHYVNGMKLDTEPAALFALVRGKMRAAEAGAGRRAEGVVVVEAEAARSLADVDALLGAAGAVLKAAPSPAFAGGGKGVQKGAASEPEWVPPPSLSPRRIASVNRVAAESAASAVASLGLPFGGGSAASRVASTVARQTAEALLCSTLLLKGKGKGKGRAAKEKEEEGKEGAGAPAASTAPAVPPITPPKAGPAPPSPSGVLLAPGAMLHILVVDETDALLGRSGSRGAEVLYRLFAWPHVRGSTLLVVSIANAIDLTARSLPRLASLRISPAVLVFEPYSHAQLATIVSSRVAGLTAGSPHGLLHPSALELLSKKVASKDGDARKALYLARRAVQAAASRWCDTAAGVSDGELDAVLREIAGAGAEGGGEEEDEEGGEGGRVVTAQSGAAQAGEERPLCACCNNGGFAWAREGGSEAAGAGPGAGASPFPRPFFAVSLPDIAALCKSAYEGGNVRAMLALPRQAQVLLCATRGVAEREAASAARTAVYHSSFSAPTEPPIMWTTVEGAPAEGNGGTRWKPAPSMAAVVASAVKGGGGTAIPLAAVKEAYGRLCARHHLAAVSSAEFADLLDRLLTDGLLEVTGKGTQGAGGGSGRMRSAGSGRVAGSFGTWLQASVRVHASLADVDLAFGEKAFYKTLAGQVRSGDV